MIYCHRGPGFLAVVWFGSSPILSPPSPVRKLSFLLSLPVWRRSSLSCRERETWGGGGVKLYNREKAWSSISHSTVYSLTSHQAKSHNTKLLKMATLLLYCCLTNWFPAHPLRQQTQRYRVLPRCLLVFLLSM